MRESGTFFWGRNRQFIYFIATLQGIQGTGGLALELLLSCSILKQETENRVPFSINIIEDGFWVKNSFKKILLNRDPKNQIQIKSWDS